MDDADNGKVIDLAKYLKRGRRPRKSAAKREVAYVPELVEQINAVTLDLHAAASTTIKMVRLARLEIGLPDLEA